MPKPEKRKLYTKFMMIGYEIPTAKSDPGREYTLDLNSVYKNKDRTYTYTNYLHVPDTVRNDDARIRLKRLAGRYG